MEDARNEQAAGTLNRFKAAVEEFYEVYKKAKEKHDNLRVETRETAAEGCIIKIYRGTGQKKQLIVKEEGKDAADCYKKAKAALAGWEMIH